MPATQDQRAFSVTTPFGGDKLLFHQFSGTEGISQPFEFSLSLLSEDGNLDPDKILGQVITLTCHEPGDGKRYFNGVVAEFSQSGFVRNFHEYHVLVRPWLWFLTLAADCRIFQNKAVPDIFEEVAKQHNFSDYRLKLKNTPYPKWDYCVQYRETDFNFVSRLLEHEGIHYYFEHENGKHFMVLTDDASTHVSRTGYSKIHYLPPSAKASFTDKNGYMRNWAVSRQVLTCTYATTDFNFEKPKVSLLRNSTISRKYKHADFEIFDYPAESATLAAAESEKIAKRRIEELQSTQMVARGQSDSLGIAPGCKFELADYPRKDVNISYLVLSSHYNIQSDAYDSGASGDAPTISITAEAIDARTPFRPARITPKPVMHGAQTAMVVGKSGDEIYTDEMGRVKVQFHWDRAGASDEKSSCWVRVAQLWAGPQWGAIHIPRVGQEVLVDFLDGDPDRPIVTGRVYNGDAKPPYALPDNATQSGMKSRSSKEGTADNANEFRFEDKKGSEEILLHAEKILTIEVEEDGTLTVENDQTNTIKHDLTTKVSNNETREVSKKRDTTIGDNDTNDVKKIYKLTAGDEITLETGQSKIVMKKNGEIKISGDKITLSGTSKVEINGMEVKIAGSTKLDMSSDVTVQVKGTKTTVQGTMLELSGDAMAKLKGGVTMIG
jgi:type VI secretion system secreted protein VgrG